MPAAAVLMFVPGTIALLAAVLFLSALVEERFLSSRSLIVGVVRTKGNTPEYAEAFVTREFDRLLRQQGR